VVEVGSTSGFKVGDRVAFAHPNSYAEFCNVDCQSAFLLPDNISLEVGAALLLQGNTALALVKLAHAVKSGQVILVHAAAGGMGLLLVQLCKHLGATVIGTASTPEKAQLAKDAGADHVILYSHENVVEKVMLITNQRGVDAVFDGVGKSTFDDSLKCLANFGSMVSFGNASGKVDPVDIMKLVPKSIKLSRPSLFAMLNDPKDFADYSKTVIQLTLDSVLKFNIFKTYDLKDAQQAHADLESRKTNGKLLLRI
jgi:NADPH2:quinone reductase